MEIFLFTDGASRGNPGESGGGYIGYNKNKKPILFGKEYFGEKSNNQAEYLALILGIKKSLELKPYKIHIYMDSQLIISQLKGEYKVKHPNLKPLFEKVKNLLEGTKWTAKHVRRELNKDADHLANEAIDEHV